MKKSLIILTLLIVSTITKAAEYPVLCRTTQGGGSNGYQYTNKVLVSYNIYEPGGGQRQVAGYDIDCWGAGNDACPASIAPPSGEPSDIDVLKADELASYSINQIESYDLIGSETITVHVTGESFNRIYTITWISDNNLMTNSEITVTVQYVAI